VARTTLAISMAGLCLVALTGCVPLNKFGMTLEGDVLQVGICEETSGTTLVGWRQGPRDEYAIDYWVAEGSGSFKVGDIVTVGQPPEGFETTMWNEPQLSAEDNIGLRIVDDGNDVWVSGERVSNFTSGKWVTQTGASGSEPCRDGGARMDSVSTR